MISEFQVVGIEVSAPDASVPRKIQAIPHFCRASDRLLSLRDCTYHFISRFCFPNHTKSSNKTAINMNHKIDLMIFQRIVCIVFFV